MLFIWLQAVINSQGWSAGLNLHFQLSRTLRRLILAVSLALLVFIASAVLPFVAGHGISVETYSAPQTSRSYSAFYINSSFIVDNRALYSLNGILYALNIAISSNGTSVYGYSKALPDIPPGGNVSYNVSVPVYYASLPGWFLAESAYSAINLTLYISVSASYAFRFFNFRLNHSMPLSTSAMLGQQGLAYAISFDNCVQQHGASFATNYGGMAAIMPPDYGWRLRD